MDTTKKVMVGTLCLLACTIVSARLSGMRTDLRQAERDSLTRFYVSSTPNALVTPAEATETETAAPLDDRLAQYVNLHYTRIESLR